MKIKIWLNFEKIQILSNFHIFKLWKKIKIVKTFVELKFKIN